MFMEMEGQIKTALMGQLLAMGDDELILGHRDSEWCGHAPILEEDIAFANLALDEIGHAHLWYSLLAELAGENSDTYPDQLVYLRSEADFRSVQLVELPIGDWAFSMLRQYLFDTAELVRLAELSNSSLPELAGAAVKIRKEEIYHQRHSRAWVQRLGLGTEESHNRLQNALNELWKYTSQLFTSLPQESRLVEAGIVPPLKSLKANWEAQVLPFFRECRLELPSLPQELTLHREQHTLHLKVLLGEMQSVARLDPEAGW